MDTINQYHQTNLEHHIHQGIAWLSMSAEGKHTSALSYAAFELRFAVERLGVHYWASLLNREPEEHDLRDIRSFKRVENRIYELAGHQKIIDAHFAFMNIILKALNISDYLHTPNIGKLSSYWHKCSEFCHIAWPLSCATSETCKNAYTELNQIAQILTEHVSSLGWPIIQDPTFAELQKNFLEEHATEADVLAWLQHVGLWAKVEFSDGRPSQFVGNAIPPSC